MQMSRTFRNWNNSAVSRPAVVAEPRTLDELILVVRDVESYPSPLRVGGSFHSMNECFATEGTQVLLKHFKSIAVDIEAMTVTVGAAVEMLEIRAALRPHGMQTEVMPEIGNATAGSVCCCGTKDGSIGDGSGQVCSTAVAMKMMNARGEVESFSEADDPEAMAWARCSYGLFGIVFEVTFRIQPLVLIETTYKTLRLDPLPTREEIFDGADGVLGFLLPYSNMLVVERRRIVPDGGRIGRFTTLKRRARDKMWELGVSYLTTKFPYNRFFSLHDRMVSWVLGSLDLLGGLRGYRSDSMIDFRFDRRHYFDFTFWGVPASRWEECIPQYLEFCRKFRRETGYRTSLPTEVYFINRDTSSPMSFSYSERIYTMDLVDSRPNDPNWIEFNRRFNDFVSRFGARPLLNQTKGLSREVVQRTLGGDWERLLELRAARDPGDRFLSPFFRDLM